MKFFQNKAKELTASFDNTEQKIESINANTGNLQPKVQVLERELREVKDSYVKLEKLYNKLQASNMNLREDNKFLKAQIKRRIDENLSTEVIIQDIYQQIESSLLTNASKDCMDLLRSIYEKLKKVCKQKVRLKNLLNQYTEEVDKGLPRAVISSSVNPRRTKRKVIQSSQRSKEAQDNSIRRLREENTALEKRIRYLKSQNGLITYDKNELQQIFIKSLNDVKKIIYRRKYGIEPSISPSHIDNKIKLKISIQLQGTVRKLEKLGSSKGDIKWEEFTLEDKFNLIALFVCNRIVITHFYRILFPESAARMNMISNNYSSDYQTDNIELLSNLHKILNIRNSTHTSKNNKRNRDQGRTFSNIRTHYH